MRRRCRVTVPSLDCTAFQDSLTLAKFAVFSAGHTFDISAHPNEEKANTNDKSLEQLVTEEGKECVMFVIHLFNEKETIGKSKTGISFWRGEVDDTVNLKSGSSSAVSP
ncbi:hypothetical protein STEG23_033198 [Scotinomys teguina]